MLAVRKISRILISCAICVSFNSVYAFDIVNNVVPSYTDVRNSWQSSDIKLLAKNGQLLQTVRTDFKARKGDWLELQQISPALQKAVIRSEDKRFYQHSGVDWLATLAAAWASVVGDNIRGASTITMQLAALLDPSLQRKAGGRSIATKIDQMQLAQIIEKTWDKEQILEAYLNLANYKGELTGIDILARVLFQKRANSLSLRESALAAVLLRGPNANQIVLNRRACALLKDNLARPDLCKNLNYFIASVLSRSQSEGYFENQLAPHFARLMLEQNPNALTDKNIIYSSMDYDLQKYANYVIRQHLLDLRYTGITDAALVVLDNKSGDVLAYVGSSGNLSQAYLVDHARSLRQAGSTLKPFLYAQAIDKQYITAASLLNDAPLDLDAGDGLYVPDNYDHVFAGWVSTRTALASSLNIPTVRVLTMLGLDDFGYVLKSLGLPLEKSGDYYGYSLALGSADVDLLSLSNAYRALARGGNYQSLPWEIDKSKQIFSNAAAWIVGDILSDRQARVRTFGLDSSLATPYWTAVKTGTSRDMRDNWTLGWSDKYTVGVWVGNSAGASMRDVSGVTGAGPIWRDIFTFLNQRKASYQPPMPTGVNSLKISFDNLIEPSRTEYFIADTGSKFIKHGSDSESVSHMVEPVNGTILAMDPEIPFAKQRMQLVAHDIYARPAAQVKWYVNGVFYAKGAHNWWQIKPGSHVFELRDEFDKLIDTAKIKVHAIKADFNSRSNE